MVDNARQLLDELMGRNRNALGKTEILNCFDASFCQYYLVKFCPHDLFVNTRADLGQCSKLHDDEAKRLFDETRSGIKKRQYEDEFLRFCSNMINEVDRKIIKGKQRLLLMNKNGELPVSKFQEQINILNDRIKKLVGEAEEAGIRGDVEQAQGLMTLCDKLKEEKDAIIKSKDTHWSVDLLAQAQEKQMEVCEVCGAFLIVGDAQQRIDDHLTGKQHLGYSRLRKAVEDMYEKRQKERGSNEDKRRDDDRSQRADSSNGRRDLRDDRNRRPRDDRRGRDRQHHQERHHDNNRGDNRRRYRNDRREEDHSRSRSRTH